ncbi:MAG: hypothetical protein WBF77_04925 [Sulfurimonadaceae bacterium]
MMKPYFKEMQATILEYREKFDTDYITIDKTNQMFHDLSSNILEYFGTEDAELLDSLCEYNIITMHEQFEKVVEGNLTNEKAQGILMMFFLRSAKEIEIRAGKIENESLNKLYMIMTAKGYKYPDYISTQKRFALERLPEVIARIEMLK